MDDPTTTFADLGLREELLTALTGLGYEEPTPIQREAIPAMVSGRDVLGQAATGTGKTAAFALPLLQALPEGARPSAPTALVLVPTRELAMQVSEAIHKYGRALSVRVLAVYGGQPIRTQLRALDRGVDVVVATPGRAADLVSRGSLALDAVRVVVLDEADEMMDMGFADDLDAILDAAPSERQTVLFSATMPPRIAAIASKHLRDAARIELGRAKAAEGDSPLVRQTAFVVPRQSKSAALARVLDVEAPTAALVFCRTRDEVDTLAETLSGRGLRAEALHGGMDQNQRDKVMGKLRSGAAELLVATDVAARGLDVDHLTHVVNYDVPSAPATYVHRIGRVGRAGREGVAITLATPRENRMLRAIEQTTGTPITIERLPTVADLRARRLEMLRASLESVLADDDLDGFRGVVASLADEHDLLEVAAAAAKLAHESGGGAADDEEDIPDAKPDRSRDSGRGAAAGAGAKRESRKPSGEGMTRLFVSAGRQAGIRPQDLVGAIANESSVRGRQIGQIQIADRFSLVEVPEENADEVIKALQSSTIKGRRAKVGRDRFER